MQGRVPRKHFRFLRKKSRFLQHYPKVLLDQAALRARSVARSTYSPTYSLPRRSYDDEYVHIPFNRPYSSSYGYDSTGNENWTRSQVNRELVMSSAAMEDNFDISNRSRQRDRDVITAANKAISPSVTTTPGLDNMSRGVSEVRRTRSLRRSNPRSSSVPHSRPSVTTTSIIPLDLTASPPPRPSPYLKYSNSLNTTSSLRDNTYRPLYSKLLRASPSPPREYSPFRDDSPFRDVSPYRSESPFATPRSGTQTPVEHWYLAESKPLSRRRRRPRVLSTKRKLGNYYNRLLNRRAVDSGGQMGKYWPYIDVEDIENTSVGELFSDTESIGDSNTTYLVTGGSAGSSYGDYRDTDGALVTYSPDSDSDIPSEYVPFKPRARYRSPERDYSEYSIIPYLPKRDPTKNSSADDIAFNALVAASAARARQALERVNLDEYDSASMVFSVEGEYHPPEGDIPVGFRYVSRPLALKVPAQTRVSIYDSDDAFTKYMTDLQAFREGIRKRLEEGYRALSEHTKSYTPALPSSSYESYTSRPSRALTPYRKRLRESTDYKYGQSLELYPVTASHGDTRETMRSRSLQRTSAEAYPESRAIKLYDSNTERDPILSTLDKVQIKAATELYSSPRATVAARRAMRGHSTPPGPYQTSANISKTEVHVALARANPFRKLRASVPPASVPQFSKLRASVPPASVPQFNKIRASVPPASAPSRRQTRNPKAALIGSKVEVTTPARRRPKSAYAQAKIRQIHYESSSRDASPVGATAALAADTSGLKAHKPVYVPTHVKPIQDVDGPRTPNIMSWQYRIDAYTPPEDLVFLPRKFSSVKAQLLNCKDKLDRHRQLMDRYLVTDTGMSVDDMQVLMNMKSRNYQAETALPNEIKPSERAKRRRLKLLKKHRLEY